MKILKILLILLVPAIGFVGCKKSDLKTAGPCSHAPAKTNDASNTQMNSRILGSGDEVEQPVNPNGTTIVGSGDDDRDGGDKKQKKTLR